MKNIIILTSSPLDNQSGDSGLNSRHCHWCDESNTSDCAHGHSTQNSARLPRSALQNHLETHSSGLVTSGATYNKEELYEDTQSGYLCQSLLAGCGGKFGHRSDDFTRSPSGHHLCGEDRDRRFHARTARHTCKDNSIKMSLGLR